MPLNDRQRRTLMEAIHSFDFPCVTFDFEAKREIVHTSMREVERSVRSQLISPKTRDVKSGLSNVLFWGYAGTGFRDYRVKRFRARVTDGQLTRAQLLFQKMDGVGLRDIVGLRLPEFSGMSFVSKIRMFLDPASYVVLDQELLELRNVPPRTLFHEISAGPKETMIRLSQHNERVYAHWSRLCKRVAEKHFGGSYRAADVERGILHLVQSGHAHDAAGIVHNA